MNIVWGLLIVVVADAAAITVMLLIRRRAPDGGFFSDSDRASGVFGVLATGFAIFAGFVVFLAFTRYDESRTGSQAEALAVVQQYETAQFMPPATRDRLAGQLVCYARSVVHHEWPAMETGSSESAINPWGAALFRSLRLANAQTYAEQSAYSKWLDQTTDREEARRDRLHGADGIIPSSLWIVLIVLGIVVFAYVLFYADSGELARSQAMLVGSATTVVVVTLLAIHALDNPYRPGVGSIKPIAMERTLRILDELRAEIEHTSPVPCDDTGAATSA